MPPPLSMPPSHGTAYGVWMMPEAELPPPPAPPLGVAVQPIAAAATKAAPTTVALRNAYVLGLMLIPPGPDQRDQCPGNVRHQAMALFRARFPPEPH
jgi:hypothetical protein